MQKKWTGVTIWLTLIRPNCYGQTTGSEHLWNRNGLGVTVGRWPWSTGSIQGSQDSTSYIENVSYPLWKESAEGHRTIILMIVMGLMYHARHAHQALLWVDPVSQCPCKFLTTIDRTYNRMKALEVDLGTVESCLIWRILFSVASFGQPDICQASLGWIGPTSLLHS